MTLDKDVIAQLLAKSASQKRKRKPTGPVPRDYEHWFKEKHYLADDNDEPVKCENPNCLDPRPLDKITMVARVESRYMCRYCFLDGWLFPNPDQMELG